MSSAIPKGAVVGLDTLVSDSQGLGMQFCVLGSGSKGNCTLVEAEDTRILVDAGFSGKEIERRLSMIGRDATMLSAVVVTHEHNDHVAGVGVLGRRYAIPVYMNQGTHEACRQKIKELPELQYFTTGESFSIQGVNVHPFAISHDTVDPVGFVFQHKGLHMGYCTDTGKITKLIRHHLRKCRALILEANHDPGMLRNGPYPIYLQQRILSAGGHLENEDALHFASELCSENLCHLVLAHLSETNNAPEIVGQIMQQYLNDYSTVTVHIAAQDKPGPFIRVAE
ncbi:MBL fold metallo-hydrolase [Desulfogranum japonicum]|uniref:MBL fold metallo-hydrolase n=1 Tax=Desulfogranum japonicum TaxID=231447 RepID=UPI001E443899|nr:MBL fold metallo-hydrolase [Desulfogranum japonicum]